MATQEIVSPCVASGNPHFFQPLLPGFQHRLSIPVEFSKHLPTGVETALLRSQSGKLYSVNISGRKFRDAGWKEFVADHGLHVGDFLLFRKDACKVFDVMVFDPSSCEIEYPSSQSSLPSQDTLPVDEQTETGLHCGTTETNNGEAQTSLEQRKADWSEPKNPSFVVTLGKDNLEKGRLYIPTEFARKNDLQSMTPGRTATLLDGEGRSWTTNICSYKPSNNQANCHVILGRGFAKFRKENKLKMGDKFSLELVEGGHSPVFRFSGLLQRL
ncbi:B3 domain-containing protein REM10 [Linum perenne]